MSRLMEFIVEKYRKISIQQMIAISFTLISVIGMFSVGVTLYIRYINSNKETIAQNNIAILEQVNINIDSYVRNMKKISNSVYYSVIKRADFNKDSIENELNLLYDTNKDSIVSICVFLENGDLVASSPLGQLKKTANPAGSEWFQKAIDEGENVHFSTPHIENLFFDPNYEYHWVVSLSRQVELTYDGKVKRGVLVVDMNFRSIEQIFKNVTLRKSSYTYLVHKNGEIIYHPRQQLIYSNLLEENNLNHANLEDGNHNEVFQGQQRVITVKTMGYTGWKIVCVTPMRDITSDYNQMKVFVIVIMTFAIIILILINKFVAMRITNPITELENSVRKLESGAKDIEISIKGSYEITHLGNAIQSMVDQLHSLMDNIVKEQEGKRKSELNALQAQINPHFLYNTLDSIIWMIENGNYEGAINMVTALAKLFRISLSKGKNIITVKSEMEHAENYLKIQSIRYKNKFEYRFEVEDEVLDLMSIKLIVQPLIENAIYHGMEFMEGDGEIVISAYIKDKDLYIDVKDNGLGMEQEVADELLLREIKSTKKGSGTGLKNVNARIKLYCGDDYGLKIYSEPDEGTTISIHMPCVKYEDIQNKET